MLFHLPQIRDNVRSEFNQAGASGFITPAEIDLWCNEGYYKYALMLMKASQGYFETTALRNIVANNELVELPHNFSNQPSLLSAVIVERVLSGSRVPLEYRKRYDQAVSTTGGASGESYLPTYDFRGNNLVLEPTPVSSENGGLRVVYKALPPRLRSANAQAGANATITLDIGADPRDDYYNGSRIYIYSGLGAGQIRTISDYVGATKVATVSSDWAINPDSTSVFSTLIHDDFPEIFHPLIQMYATKKAFLKERSHGQKSHYDASALKEMESQFVQFIEERTQSRKFVEPWNIELA
jgi:hypothetical protein